METKFKFRDANNKGNLTEGSVSVTDYAKAANEGLSLSQFMAKKFPTDEAQYGSVLSQALTSNNLHLTAIPGMGIQASKMSEMFNGGLNVQAGAITSPDGTANNTPAGRIFFPEVILQTIAANLSADKTDFFEGYQSLIGGTELVNAPEFKRARIDVTAPEDSESMSTAQLAEPAAMVSITAADSTTPIPSKGIGLIISDQAMKNTSIDLVNTVMARQAYGERVRMVEAQLSDVFNGNSDLGMSALSSITAQSLDALVTAAGTISQKAWIHYLRDNYQTIGINKIVMDIDTALAIEGRTGKPVVTGDDPNSPRIDSLFSVDNLGIKAPSVFLVDSSVVGANTMVGLDTQWALRRYVNVSASYEAIEAFAMRRATAFRVDYGEALSRLYDEAFKKMTLTV